MNSRCDEAIKTIKFYLFMSRYYYTDGNQIMTINMYLFPVEILPMQVYVPNANNYFVILFIHHFLPK